MTRGVSNVVASSDSAPPPALGLSESRWSSPPSSDSPSPGAGEADIAARLDPLTRYAFANLVATVLRLDFAGVTENSKEMKEFCKYSLDFVLAWINLPEKTSKSIRKNLQDERGVDDITSFISSIKSDPYLEERGTIALFASLIPCVLRTGSYDSRFRVLLRHVAALLAVCWDDIEDIEDTLTALLLQEKYEETEISRKAREKSALTKKIKRYALIGAATGVGGALIGLTGGLAAPFVAASAGALIGSSVLAGLGTTVGAAIFGSAFGVMGGGLTGYKMTRRVGAVEEFQVEGLTEGQSLHVVLCISGFINEKSKKKKSPAAAESTTCAFAHQWRNIEMSREQYILRYESQYLEELGNTIDYFATFAISVAAQGALKMTILGGLLTAIAWPVALISASSIIDNPWSVCMTRSVEVGEQLAEMLLSRSHGRRPITLIGFSLGARVIYHCLLAMQNRSDHQGIIEDVVLLGAPVSASSKQWAKICSVVGGRILNGYCTTDWLLRFLYRTMSVQATIAGISPIDNKQSNLHPTMSAPADLDKLHLEKDKEKRQN